MAKAEVQSESLYSLKKLRELANYLRTSNSTLDEVMQFIALNTFSDRFVITVLLATVRRDGVVSLIAKFGCSDEAFAEIPDRKVSVDVPVNTALRTGAIMDCGSLETYKFSGPGYRDRLFPNGFACSIAFPIPGIGAAYLFCAEPYELDVKAQEFLLIVGRMLSMEMARIRQLDIDLIPHRRMSVPSFGLTGMQWQIYEGVASGRSNKQIAQLLSISETAVTHELARIMNVLKVQEREQIPPLQKP